MFAAGVIPCGRRLLCQPKRRRDSFIPSHFSFYFEKEFLEGGNFYGTGVELQYVCHDSEKGGGGQDWVWPS